MNKAAFSLDDYHFEKIDIDFSQKTSNDIDVGFSPSGKFFSGNSTYELTFEFMARSGESERPFVKIECIALFKFASKIEFEEIPSYFYRNSIAIIFPYVRAFISTVTLQANVPPLVLPTMNLLDLEKPLKENTEQI